MLKLLGRFTIGALIPKLLDVEATVEATLGPLVAALEARIGGYNAVNAKALLTPPSVVGSLDLTKKIVAALNANAKLTPPAVDFGAKAVADATAKINAIIGDLNALASLAADLDGIAGAAGVKLFLYEGTLGELSATLSGAGGIAAQAGIAGSVPVFLPLFIVDGGNGATKAAIAKVMAV